MDKAEGTREDSLGIVLVAPLLVAVLPALNLLLHHEYRLASAESLLLLFAVGLPAALIAVLQLLHPLLRVALLALLVTLAMTVELDLGIAGALLLLLAVAVGGVIARAHLGALLCVMFGSMIVVGLIRGSGTVVEHPEIAPTDEKLPLLLHLVLDGHSGIGGLPQDLPGGAAVARELADFFDEHGFVRFDQAYSRYNGTANSLRNLFNFTAEDHNYFTEGQNGDRVSQHLGRPAYFQKLHERGYALRITHPQYIDYCGSIRGWVSSCYSYSSLNLKSIENAALSAPAKTRLMLQVLVRQSAWLTQLYEAHHRTLGLPRLVTDKLPGSNEFQVRRLIEDLGAHGRGYAHIVHLLSPHAPLIWNDRCEYQPQRTLEQVRARDRNVEATLVEGRVIVTRGLNTYASRAQRYQYYFDSMRCNLRWLGQIFAGLQQSGLYEDAIIILHGDHGSRISTLVPVAHWQDQFSVDDYRDTYATLFAVKGVEPGIEPELLPLEVILASVVNRLSAVAVPSPSAEPFVYFLAGDGSERLVKVPQQGSLGAVAGGAAAGQQGSRR